MRDKTGPPNRLPLPAATVAKILALTCCEPPYEATHWTGRAMAKAVGISVRAGQCIWAAHGLQLHRIPAFKRSNDPVIAERREDIVGLYLNPPAHAIVLSIKKKSQIQALDRALRGLLLKPGKCGTMTHGDERHGIATLFAALDVLDGTFIGQNMQHHRHLGFICILNAVEAQLPIAKVVHNYAPHTHPKVQACLARHPHLVFHFTPTSVSWLNTVETFVLALSRRRLRHGAFCSMINLQTAIDRYTREHNDEPKPFISTKSTDAILAKTSNLPAPSE